MCVLFFVHTLSCRYLTSRNCIYSTFLTMFSLRRDTTEVWYVLYEGAAFTLDIRALKNKRVSIAKLL